MASWIVAYPIPQARPRQEFGRRPYNVPEDGGRRGVRKRGGMRMSEIDKLLAGYPVTVEVPVAWGEMDYYRHVNNVVYFRYFENARLEYFRRLDWFEYERVTGVGPILAATQARFRKPLTYPDRVTVAARIPSLEA